MTPQQKEWLDAHADEKYQPIGQPGGLGRYIKRGVLHADGRFEPVQRGRLIGDVIAASKGSFGVGVVEVTQPGKSLPDPRNDHGPRGVGR